jgi:hypothetical protein
MISTLRNFKEFQVWDEEHGIPQNIVASFQPHKLQELLYYLSKSRQYSVYYYIDGASWMIQVHDRYADEQVLLIPDVLSIVFPPIEFPKIIEEYF